MLASAVLAGAVLASAELAGALLANSEAVTDRHDAFDTPKPGYQRQRSAGLLHQARNRHDA